MKKSLLILGIVLAILLGLFFIRANIVVKDVSQLEPNELVETYYKSLNWKALATAKSCLSDEYAQNFSVLYELNTLYISDLSVSEPFETPYHGSNYKEVQISVEYNAYYIKEQASANGKHIRFIYVAKETEDSPWKIISIGTGP